MVETVEELTARLRQLGTFPSKLDVWEVLLNLSDETYAALIAHLNRCCENKKKSYEEYNQKIFDAARTASLFETLTPSMVDFYDNSIINTYASTEWHSDIIAIVKEIRHPADFELYSHPDFQSACAVIVPDFNRIYHEFIEYVSKHPDVLWQLPWRKYEQLLEAIFRNQGYDTILGPGRNDGGVDLRLIHKDPIGEMVTLVQAKRNNPRYPVELEAVSALYGVVELHSANRGLFVTTSRYLPSARQFAAQTKRRIKLADSNDVKNWCKAIVRQQK